MLCLLNTPELWLDGHSTLGVWMLHHLQGGVVGIAGMVAVYILVAFGGG